jgi:aconitate hydratase
MRLNGSERLTIAGLGGALKPRQELPVEIYSKDGTKAFFTVVMRLDTPIEINYWRNGGILHTVLRKMLK